jgi:hypothetical protein
LRVKLFTELPDEFDDLSALLFDPCLDLGVLGDCYS